MHFPFAETPGAVLQIWFATNNCVTHGPPFVMFSSSPALVLLKTHIKHFSDHGKRQPGSP